MWRLSSIIQWGPPGNPEDPSRWKRRQRKRIRGVVTLEGKNRDAASLVLKDEQEGCLSELERARKQIFFEVCRKEQSSADTLMFSPCQTSDLRNCEIDLCCFKPLSLWSFVTAAREN